MKAQRKSAQRKRARRIRYLRKRTRELWAATSMVERSGRIQYATPEDRSREKLRQQYARELAALVEEGRKP